MYSKKIHFHERMSRCFYSIESSREKLRVAKRNKLCDARVSSGEVRGQKVIETTISKFARQTDLNEKKGRKATTFQFANKKMINCGRDQE